MNPEQTAAALGREAGALRFGPPVAYIYNPLDYARAAHAEYLRRYGSASPRECLLLGMNPGPFGMAQTGVPFGDAAMARDWMGIDAPVAKPPREHPRRPVWGFACPRGEVSGARLWGWARERFGAPENFFARFFVANYCPLCFMEESGRNRTPDKLPAAERDPLYAVCDMALRRLAEYFRPRWVVGIGAFAERRAREALRGMDIGIGRILHPSPASPLANRHWAAQAEAALAALGIALGP
ncbi:MAG: Uracil DNA glycosylase superfamily protein [candidate division BRC1 bacterium ADurb.BinA364]|nr:MAG: Uracil DNA glycosylase superfamily protein [candidate division BRC1 bacterium ADurb.BinA364]